MKFWEIKWDDVVWCGISKSWGERKNKVSKGKERECVRGKENEREGERGREAEREIDRWEWYVIKIEEERSTEILIDEHY